MKKTAALCLVAGIASIAGANAGAQPAGGQPSVHDYRALTNIPTAYTVADTPSVRIDGGSQGVHGYNESGMTFGYGRRDLIQLSDGRLVIGAVNPPGTPRAGDHSMMLYDATGTFIRRTQIAGAMHPFPSQLLQLMELPDHSLVGGASAYGWASFADNGLATRAGGRGTRLAGVFPDGTLLVEHRTLVDPWSANGQKYVVVTSTFGRASVDGLTEAPLPLTIRVPMMYADDQPPPSEVLLPWPVSVLPGIVTSNGVIWTIDVMKWELRAYDANGLLLTTILPPRPAALAAPSLTRGYGAEEVVRNVMLADDRGRVWLETSDVSTIHPSKTPSTWVVIDSAGQLIGSVAMPAGFRPYQVTRQSVLGVSTLANRTSFVALHQLLQAKR